VAIGPHAESEKEVLEPKDLKGPVGARLRVSLVTPRGALLEREVDEIIAPGAEGEFGVLTGHVAFLSALKPGVLTIRDATRRERFAVRQGFLEVGAGGVARILVQEAVAADEIDLDAAASELAAAQDQLRGEAGGSQEGSLALQARVAWAQARIAARAVAPRS
jgi:F-type H+-transporting ATPase subunit epsilon